MTQPTSTNWGNDKRLATQWQQFIGSLANPGAQDINHELRHIAAAQQSNIEPLLGVYAEMILEGRLPSPTSSSELLDHFTQFITQGINDYEQRAIAFEQKFIDAFLHHAIMRLTPQSFRPGSRAMANDALDATIGQVRELIEESSVLEIESNQLKKAFNDPQGRIILAHSRVHTVTNKLTVIHGFAHELRIKEMERDERRQYLQAIQTTIRKFAERDHPTLADDPLELFRRMNPHVGVNISGRQPVFIDPITHPRLIVETLGHLVRNSYAAGARRVTIMAEYLPTDPVYTIAVQDDGPGIAYDELQTLIDGTGGSGWHILRRIILPKLGAHYKIVSPHQADTDSGTLVMLYIPVVSRTGDEPDSSFTRKIDGTPRPAMSDVTPPTDFPAIERPRSFDGVEPALASATTCFGTPPATIIKFPKLK